MTRRAQCFGCGEFLKAGAACRSCKNMTNNKPSDVRVVPVELLEEALRRITSVRGKEVAAEISRILAQPADQQGEPVAFLTDGGKSFYFPGPNIEIRKGDEPLYRHSQPATEKVVLPAEDSRRTATTADIAFQNGWNACLDEVANLNGGQS